MAFLIRKFQEVAITLAKSPKFARDPRHLQFEADINRLFLYTSFNRLGRNADEKDAEEIIEMASKASVADQQRQVQENIHYQIKNICSQMDDILKPDPNNLYDLSNSPLSHENIPKRSGLSFAVGASTSSTPKPAVTRTKLLSRIELSSNLKDRIRYTLDVKPSQIPHKEAGLGLYLSGECNVGSVIAFYPGIIYSPAYYRYIPGYPRVDSCNSYLITRYDDIIINAQPWGVGGESREIWEGSYKPNLNPDSSLNISKESDRLWKILSKPLESSSRTNSGEVLELRNPLSFGHFANHPANGCEPNIMVCPYDFPVMEKDMRVYIPNIVFGGEESVRMKRVGSFWFRLKGGGDEARDVMKTLVLVATRPLCEEEVYLNYRLSNSRRRPSWYVPVDQEEDQRRWS
ncbi:uncharacterized protein LOC110017866 isoform X2 [Phalaenopsis equestris]|uniref:uncharacterized protein LOC110017866 isoform X2 n=1 Tax=Phalaenopsis equestris TaxID=78828 RepID=UPI0009E54FEC|nr:uncharacterized protein LOC110017866 isoform X2 [Phalaenopsis equestris]